MLNIEKVKSLPEEMKIKLRRSFGQSVSEISMENAIAFYSVIPQELTVKEEENYFFIITMYCHYRDNAERGDSFSESLSRYYNKCSDSGKKEVLALMDAPYDINGTFLPRLYSLIRKMESKEIYVDAQDMYRELKFWDAKSKQRKVRIAKSIVSPKEDFEK